MLRVVSPLLPRFSATTRQKKRKCISRTTSLHNKKRAQTLDIFDAGASLLFVVPQILE